MDLIDKVAEVGGLRNTAMEILLFGLGNIKPVAGELTGRVVFVRSFIPPVTLVVGR